MDIFEKLVILREPTELKRQAQIAREQYPDMNEDSLTLWLEGFCSYLWATRKWRDILKSNGVTWQSF